MSFEGVKTVSSKTTGNEKLRVTSVMTICLNGVYLPTMIIFKNLKKPPSGPFPKDVIVTATMKGVMTSELMLKVYIPQVSYTNNAH